ncbi:MAG: hypothetical protein LBE97_01365 [Holosporales bacterium]|jgi:uncharacterized protein YoxC|nr:hypothetical protein [Holosporales bacterium]
MNTANKTENNKNSKLLPDSSSSNRKKFNFTEELFNKKIGYVIFFSAIISILSSIIVIKGFINYQDRKVQEILDGYNVLNNKVKGILDSVSEIESSINTIKDDFKSTKENLVHVYTNIASIQNDLAIIKEEFHVNNSKNVDDMLKKLNSEKSDFIVSLNNLIQDGIPFESFLESYESKIDMKKYPSVSELLKFKSIEVKSLSALKKDIAAIGSSLFNLAFEEGFWEKQKRIIKEKIMDAIKIKKIDEKEAPASKDIEDKSLYEEAVATTSNGDLEKALALLENIKLKNEALNTLISDIKKRIGVNKAFSLFKNEFIEMETEK